VTGRRDGHRTEVMSNELAYVPFFVGDFLVAVRYWPPERIGAYTLALFYQVEDGGLPANDEDAIALILHVSKSNARRLWGEIKHKFFERDGLWWNAKMETVLIEARRVNDTNITRARRGALARWGKGANGNTQARGDGKHSAKHLVMLQASLEQSETDANQIQNQIKNPPNPPSTKGGSRRRRRPTAAQEAEAEQLRKTQEVKRLVREEGLTIADASRRVGF
jgi:uncharacterized protein YdaU (DUF1376 family)